MKKIHTHHRLQLIRSTYLRDHHVALAIFCCALAVIITASIVREWKNISMLSIFHEITQSSAHLATNTRADIEVGVTVLEAPAELPRALDGVLVPAAESNLTPLCVMIENLAYEGVRPQYGLSEASVIYEVIVEGGITRFMAVFAGPGRIDMIGPVRSARDTYLEFASEYNCSYFHAGGSFTAIQALRRLKMRDVDGLIEYKYFWRERSRYAPHNFFTSLDNLRTATKNHHWYDEGAPTFASWLFQHADDLMDESALTNATDIQINFGTGYDVSFAYDATSNTYLRKNAGVAHMDAGTKTQLAPHTVIIQHVGAGIPIEGKGRVNWPVTGEGVVEIFHDGHVYAGRWTKPSRVERTQFVDEDGKSIPLGVGQVWIAIVPEHITSSYQ